MDDFPFVLTAHARKAIEEREIPLTWILRVLTDPDRREADAADPSLKHALGSIEEHAGRVLRVVYNDSVDPRRVVTAYFDRRERKHT